MSIPSVGTTKAYQYAAVLTIAGSDPSGGAGIQADMKTFSSLGCYGMTVITALTAQNTVGVQAVHSPPVEFLEQQLKSIFEDIAINAIKIGMLGTIEVIHKVADCLKAYKQSNSNTPVVVDPVMFAKSGYQLIQNDAIQSLKNEILPLATILTPNIHEACHLLGRETIKNESDMEKAAFSILDLGPEAVIVKGGTLHNEAFTLVGRDCLVIKGDPHPHWLKSERVNTTNLHGTGCTFSAAIASFLAKEPNVLAAVEKAKKYISNAIIEGAKYEIGHGKGPVHHFHSVWQQENFTQKAFSEINSLYEKIQRLPFLNELAAGSLPDKRFAFYIMQDHLFLLDRAKAFEILASKAPTQELAEYLTKLSKLSQQGAEQIFKKYSLPVPPKETLQKSEACKHYTETMLETASKRTCNEGLVFLLPCTLLYQMIAETMQPGAQCPAPYRLWIETYSSPDRREKVETMVSIVDQAVARSSYDEIQNLKALFAEASKLEYNFWNDTSDLES